MSPWDKGICVDPGRWIKAKKGNTVLVELLPLLTTPFLHSIHPISTLVWSWFFSFPLLPSNYTHCPCYRSGVLQWLLSSGLLLIAVAAKFLCETSHFAMAVKCAVLPECKFWQSARFVQHSGRKMLAVKMNDAPSQIMQLLEMDIGCSICMGWCPMFITEMCWDSE